MCPATVELRTAVASVDTVIFYQLKSVFATWCDMEDSFYRFILDTWVHSIVLQTDNTLMLLQTLPHALMFNVILVYVFVPVVSVIYAVVLNALYQA